MSRVTHTLSCVLAIGCLASCSDLGTESFDPMGSSQKAQEAFTRVTSNAAVRSFAALQTAFTFSPGAPLQGNEPRTQAVPTAPDAVPASALGKTFFYNTQTAKYEANDQPGAPANGARFILYQVSGTPASVTIPLVPIGHVDLTNESTPAPNSAGIKAVIGTATVVDYKAGGAITGKGSVMDGTGRLDLDLSLSFSSNVVNLDYKVSSPDPDITIRTVAVQTGVSEPTTTTLTVTEGRNTLEVKATGSTAAVTGTVKYNGHDIARISGSGTAPVFTGQGGRQISAAEIDGLRQLYEFVDVLFEGIDDLLVPAYFAL